MAHSKELQETIENQKVEMQDIYERTIGQQKLIDSLLPQGASAGLASSFAARAGKIESTRRLWGFAFFVSVISLAGVLAYYFWGFAPDKISLESILYRVTLTMPFVWSAWFSAIQYGNAFRIQEDYAFKEATAKAFIGYKDHFEHMTSVNAKESSSALESMTLKTIGVLSNDPLRIFGKNNHDATPMAKIEEFLKAFKKGKDAPEE